MALHHRADEFDSTIVSLSSSKSISVCRSKRMARLREDTFFVIRQTHMFQTLNLHLMPFRGRWVGPLGISPGRPTGSRSSKLVTKFKFSSFYFNKFCNLIESWFFWVKNAQRSTVSDTLIDRKWKTMETQLSPPKFTGPTQLHGYTLSPSRGQIRYHAPVAFCFFPPSLRRGSRV